MKSRTSFMVVVAFAVLTTRPGGANAMLYGVSHTADSLYTIDPSTGVDTLVTPISPSSIFRTGASLLGGELFITDMRILGMTIGTVDTATGVFTAVGDQDGSLNWHGLATDDATGLLYTIDLNDSNILKSMTAAGTVVSIGTGTGIEGRGMAYDDANDILYASDGSSLYTVSTATGTSTLVGDMGIATDFIGLAYDEVSRTLYANAGLPLHSLYTLDVATGAATLVGPNVVHQIDGLAWVPDGFIIPEPATLSLLGLGLLALRQAQGRPSRRRCRR